MKTNLPMALILCLGFSSFISAQIIRPFTARYYNPAVRGNIVYVANSIISSSGVGSGTPGTGEVPPNGTTINNTYTGINIDVDNPASVTLLNYGSTWNYFSTSSAPPNDASSNTWKQTAYTLTGAAWNTGGSGSGAGKYGYLSGQTTCLPSGCTPICTPATNCSKYISSYFRTTINIPDPSLYGSIVLNLKRDDGVVVYINGTERARDNMPAGVPAYGTLASSDIAVGAEEDFTISLSPTFFISGNNSISVEIHLDAAKADDMSFDMEVLGVPIDNSGTFNSSTADLDLPACSQVIFAGLYWGTGQGIDGANTSWIVGETTCKFKIPGAASYTTITSAQTDYHNVALLPGYAHTGYKCFADVTSLIPSNPDGTYTVGNVIGPIGILNAYGGWNLVIVYSNSSLPLRNVRVFDGNALVKGTNVVDISLTGFLTPPSGVVSCELGAVVFDGDRNAPDAIKFKQNGAGSFYDITQPLGDMWNSKISYKGVVATARNPAFYNTLGYNADIVDLPNAGNAQLGNNQTSANVELSSSADNYIVQLITTSILQYDPTFALDNISTDVNGGSLVAGDILRYEVAYTNEGNDASTNSIMLDNIPLATGFRPGSIKIDGVTKTDGSGDDQAEYDAPNNRVVFRLGTGANAASGGTLAIAATGTIQFDVTVASSCPILSCVSSASNSARINYIGQTSLQSLYDSSGVTTGGCLARSPLVNAIASDCYIPLDTALSNTCPVETINLPADKYAGYSFYSAQPYIPGNIYNPCNPVTQTGTYWAYFTHVGGCTDEIQINSNIISCFVVLPAHLISFNAAKTLEHKVRLTWNINDELLHTKYLLQRSNDAQNWEIINEQSATSNRASVSYEFIDEQPVNKTNYYRLRLIQPDASHNYSQVIKIIFEKALSIKLIPNPVLDDVILNFNADEKSMAILAMADESGKIVYQQNLQLIKGTNSISLPFVRNLSNGTYAVQLQVGNNIYIERLIIKKR